MAETPRHTREFSLGSGGLQSTGGPKRRRHRIFLPFTVLIGIIVIGLLVTSLAIGVRFTRSFHFENRELSFFESPLTINPNPINTIKPRKLKNSNSMKVSNP